MRWLRAALCLLLAFTPAVQSANAATALTSFTADIWADNWFALYVNGVRVAADPVPITTTKSFNKVSVTFSARYPLTIAIMAKDYTENKSGLEYIGTPQQQIGDAGLIAQIHERVSKKLVAATSKSWKSLVIFKAPLNPSCVTSTQPLTDCKSSTLATPSGWYNSSYSTAKWPYASVYTAEAVGVKEGYNEVTWDQRASLIWSSSLTADNTVLFRTTAKAAMASAAGLTLGVTGILATNHLKPDNTCDGLGLMPTLAWSGVPSSAKSLLLTFDTAAGPARPGEVAQTDFNHLVHYNLSPTASGLTSSLAIGAKGKNFKGTLGYTPPCSQGPGEKTYTFHLYALSVSLTGDALTGAAALAQAQGHIVSETKLDVFYSRS
jgi:phosphatidylethanolamine-binding protein (PEBP) family uncharacterized protein